MSIELPVTTRHRRDMTDKLLKATLNPNSHTHAFSGVKKKKKKKRTSVYYNILYALPFRDSVTLSDENFRRTFTGTVRPTKLKLGTYVDNGWMYRVYHNQACSCLFLPLFLHFSFSPIFKHEPFSTHSSQELWGL